MMRGTNTIAKLAGLMTGALVLLPVAALAQTLGSITDVQVKPSDGVTRVVVHVTGIIDIRSDKLENPARYFVDFRDTVPALGGAGPRGAMKSVPGEGKWLKQVRIAENQRGVTRLVFDLETRELDIRTVMLKDPGRLVVEIRAKEGEQKYQNPLAVPPPPVTSKVVTPRPVTVASSSRYASSYRMPDPPVLLATLKLPKPDPMAMPYRVSGYILRDFVVKRPPTAISRQADQATAPAVAAARTSNGNQSLTRVLGLKIGKVVIDAGHGGHDVGSIGATGYHEKDLTLDVAQRLATLIQTQLGSEVVLTRDDDTYIALEQRAAIANQHKADLFISIHANSSALKTAGGVETYYLNFTSSQEALEVAARENASSQRSIGELGDLVKKIALKDKLDESREFAGKVQQALVNGSARAGNRTKDRGVRKAPFIVLIGAQMPSVLAEIGFISNPKEEALLRRPDYRQKIAESLYRGISQYATTLSHFAVARAGASGSEN